jgi:hypothetical protein
MLPRSAPVVPAGSAASSSPTTQRSSDGDHCRPLPRLCSSLDSTPSAALACLDEKRLDRHRRHRGVCILVVA